MNQSNVPEDGYLQVESSHAQYVSLAQRILAADHQAEGVSDLERDQLYDDFRLSTPAERQTVDEARSIVYQYFGPFITKVAVDMLTDLHELQTAAKNRRLRVIFVGRDALALSYAVHQLDPAFHHFFCRELAPVSRTVTNRVVEKASEWWPERLDAIDRYRYRKRAPYHSRTNEPATWDDMLEYLQIDNIYLDPRYAVDNFIIVDTGYKGSIQEMLAAAYPQVTFQGFYVFHAATDTAISPKKGYVLDLDADQGFNGEAIRNCVVDDVALTFAHHDAIVAVEELLNGGLDAMLAEDPLEGINPIKIAPQYVALNVRHAVFTVSQLAVADYAAQIRRFRRATGYWYDVLSKEAELLPPQVHAWLMNRSVDGPLQQLLDSFVRRADKSLVKELSGYLQTARMVNNEKVWRSFDQCGTLDDKQTLVRRLLAQ